jgi:hypothetical protein
MDPWTALQMRDRYSRHVRRARLSVDSGAPQHRLAFAMEEALRLASLPGEHEGRSYYFRRLRISGLPANGDRNVWLEGFQRALDQEAEHAVHGADPRAGFAHAVFFRGEQEALEILLHRILARRAAREWFWPMVTAASGAGEPASSAAAILRIVEKLKAQPASWVAVAAALFAAPEFDVVGFLQAIPQALAQGWIRDMEGRQTVPFRAASPIPEPAQPAIRQALKAVGSRDIRTIWLATLAILLDSPAELTAGTAVSRARAALSRLVSEVEVPPTKAGLPGTTETIGIAGDEEMATAPAPIAKEARNAPPLTLSEAQSPADARSGIPTRDTTAAMLSEAPSNTSAAETDVSASSEQAVLESPVTARAASREPESTSPEFALQPNPTPWQCLGLPTAAAGLFFLLNALQRVGISEALSTDLASADPNFAARVLQRLAVQAGVADEDPIAIWLNSLVPDLPDDESLPCEPSCWPANLQVVRDAAPMAYMLRIWCVAVRLWCWRAGRLSVREIVSRAGVFSVNRTDLDISLPIEDADVRLRRVGLDLDSGWLPWFGRVVRFHYLFRGEFYG